MKESTITEVAVVIIVLGTLIAIVIPHFCTA